MQAEPAAYNLLFGWKMHGRMQPAIVMMWRGWSGWKLVDSEIAPLTYSWCL